MAETTAEKAAAPTVFFKKRGGNKNFRKRPATPSPANSDDSGSEYSSEDEAGRRVKRRRRMGVHTGGTGVKPATDHKDLKATQFAADASTEIKATSDATKQSNWYEDENTDSLSAANLLGKKSNSRDQSSTVDGTYKGAAGYQSFIQKSANAAERKVGPVKAPTNIRTITVTDYAPDVCKDYKQTGFCGFGDSCKFLHAREDYKQGWELDRDWEVGSKGKKPQSKTVASANRGTDTGEEEDDKLLESIPFACVICKEPYKNPIVTKCNHYFCEKCALQRYKKNPTCAICGQGTGGAFNGAKNLKKILERKRERARKRKEQARENGEEVSEDDEEAVKNGDT